MRIKEFIHSLFHRDAPCPRTQYGWQCRKNNSRYNYHCPECGRKGKRYDSDVVEQKS